LYYTRPRLEPLGLDLAEISGGGGMPAQFEGRTVDGRYVYIRYRGGQLSVHLGAPNGSDSPLDTEELLSTSIGPPLDGYIDLEQVCELAGITLNGKPFEHSPISGVRDWTGYTTYWVRPVQLTRKGERTFVQELTARLGPPIILEGKWTQGGRGQPPTSRFLQRNHIDDCEMYGHLCFRPLSGDFEKLLAGGFAEWHSIKACFEKVVVLSLPYRTANSSELAEYSSSSLPREFREKRPEMRFLSNVDGRIETDFRTDDSVDRNLTEQIVDVCNECFSNRLDKVDLETGRCTALDWDHVWYSMDLVDICRADPNLFLGFGVNQGATDPTVDGTARKYFSIRPSIPTIQGTNYLS
jgi:hypothetical protein